MSDDATRDDDFGLPRLSDLAAYQPSGRFTAAVPIAHAREHRIIGLEPAGEPEPDAAAEPAGEAEDYWPEDEPWTMGNPLPGAVAKSTAAPAAMTLAMASLKSWRQRDFLIRRLGVPVSVVLAADEAIGEMIDAAYGGGGDGLQSMIDQTDWTGGEDAGQMIRSIAGGGREDLLDSDARAPVIQLVNRILFEAVRDGASDIHIQPFEDHLRVRQRIDGVLFDGTQIPKVIQEEVLTRIKVLGRMNIAEKRLPQDGRASVRLGRRVVDLRIASLPTNHNERIVIRLLDKGGDRQDLSQLGMPEAISRTWHSLLGRDHGLILVTGPTGSGKSTTLYSGLQTLDAVSLNILTLEDPIEYELPGISQTQINEKKGMTFAAGMRSLLRQDPDVIMVGEIRDRETAQMAIEASLTGHLVLSTLHTNDAAGAVTRLLDLGVQPYLLASSLVGSLAQRLVRRCCAVCSGQKHAAGVRCGACRGSGFRGRVGLFELLVVDETIGGHIIRRRGASEINQAAAGAGMTRLAEDGRQKVRDGVTTLHEVLRVIEVPEGAGGGVIESLQAVDQLLGAVT